MVQAILTSLWIISTALAVQFRASSKAQRRALRSLRDREIEYGLYVHELRTMLSQEGHRPPDYPPKLQVDYNDLELL